MKAHQATKNHISWLLCSLTTLCIVCVGWRTGLFWDNILFINRFGSTLLEHGLWNWMSLPLQHDPGHPMLPAMYIAGMWSIFGKTMVVTHLSVIPFIFLFCYILWLIVYNLFGYTKWALATYLIVIADPCVFSQLMYIGPELFVLTFTGLAIYGIWKPSTILQTIGLMALGVTSLRGMMLCAGIFLWDICHNKKIKPIAYILGALPAITFLALRIIIKGWIISNPLAPWGG